MSSSKIPTLVHKGIVKAYLDKVAEELIKRGNEHDNSKLKSPEIEVFDEFTSKLKDTTYGSDEYKMALGEMEVALDHHYMVNRHHPEHFDSGIDDMNLIDLIEMLVDWKAASMRHEDGDIWKSLELNQQRFGYSDEIKHLLRRTMVHIEKP